MRELRRWQTTSTAPKSATEQPAGEWPSEVDVDAAAMALATFQGFELMPHGGFMRYRDGGFTESAFSRFTDQVRIVLQSASRPTEWRAIESAPRDGTRFLGATYCTTSLPGHESAELAPPWRYAVMWWDAEFDAVDFDDETGTQIYRGAWTAGSVGSWCYETYFEEQPTHWQPLPAPPETE